MVSQLDTARFARVVSNLAHEDTSMLRLLFGLTGKKSDRLPLGCRHAVMMMVALLFL